MDNVEVGVKAGGKRKARAKAAGGPSADVIAKRAAKREANKADGKVGKAGGKKTAGSVPKGPETQVARLILRALWRHDWSAANPDKKAAERTAAWKEGRQAHYEAELKKMRRALISVKRDGVSMAVSEKAAKAEADAGGDDGDE